LQEREDVIWYHIQLDELALQEELKDTISGFGIVVIGVGFLAKLDNAAASIACTNVLRSCSLLEVPHLGERIICL
jgi:hypothetical protein